MAEPSGRFLLVPAGGRGEGMGHLMRCVRLARTLGGGCDFHTGWLDDAAAVKLRRMIEGFPGGRRPAVVDGAPQGRTWDLVLIDKRRTSCPELALLEGFGTVVCLDEGGEARRHAAYLIDALPRLPAGEPPNTAALSYLGLRCGQQRARRIRDLRTAGSSGRAALRILVSFGGEDAPDLTGAFLRAALGKGVIAAANVTVVAGPLFGPRSWPAGIRIVKGVPSLAAQFARHDVLVTHFGVSALEALAAGLPVILLNPTRYHRSLGRTIRIPEIGVRRVMVARLRRLLSDRRRLAACPREFAKLLASSEAGSLAGHLAQMSPAGAGCPACGTIGRVVGRFPLRTYRHCRGCRIEYLQSFAAPPRRYTRGYYFEEYRAQYGRTYLEDFAAIAATGRERVALLERVLGRRARGSPRGTVVDVGCAFGPFLAALREAGWPCFGIDVSPDAVAYVKHALKLPAAVLPLERLERRHVPGERIDAVTLWYVIEHLDDLDAALRRLADLLGPGAALAFSTPNGRGISARASRRSFLAASPFDHRTILHPRAVRGLLGRYGFRLARIRITGHHPERFPGLLGRFAGFGAAARGLVRGLSRVAGLGDTFEAYAVRTRSR